MRTTNLYTILFTNKLYIRKGKRVFLLLAHGIKNHIRNKKILRAYYWIDVLDFFKTYDETFGAGFRFQPEQILVEANINDFAAK